MAEGSQWWISYILGKFSRKNKLLSTQHFESGVCLNLAGANGRIRSIRRIEASGGAPQILSWNWLSGSAMGGEPPDVRRPSPVKTSGKGR